MYILQYYSSVIVSYLIALVYHRLGRALKARLYRYLDGGEVDVDVVMSAGEWRYAAVTDNGPTLEPYFNEPRQLVASRRGREVSKMDFHGFSTTFPRFFQDFYGFSWIFMDFHGLFMDFSWIFLVNGLLDASRRVFGASR